MYKKCNFLQQKKIYIKNTTNELRWRTKYSKGKHNAEANESIHTYNINLEIS